METRIMKQPQAMKQYMRDALDMQVGDQTKSHQREGKAEQRHTAVLQRLRALKKKSSETKRQENTATTHGGQTRKTIRHDRDIFDKMQASHGNGSVGALPCDCDRHRSTKVPDGICDVKIPQRSKKPIEIWLVFQDS